MLRIHARMSKVAAVALAALALVAGPSGCGADSELDSLSLALEFGPNTMPAETSRLMIYTLPSLVTVDGQEEAVNCDLFVGPTADKTVYDYSSHFVQSVVTIADYDPAARSAVELKELPDMLLVFIIEALDEPGNLLAVGCGKGQIERGKKTFIPIYMELR